MREGINLKYKYELHEVVQELKAIREIKHIPWIETEKSIHHSCSDRTVMFQYFDPEKRTYYHKPVCYYDLDGIIDDLAEKFGFSCTICHQITPLEEKYKYNSDHHDLFRTGFLYQGKKIDRPQSICRDCTFSLWKYRQYIKVKGNWDHLLDDESYEIEQRSWEYFCLEWLSKRLEKEIKNYFK